MAQHHVEALDLASSPLETMAAHFPGGSFMASWNEPFTVHAGDWLCMPHPDGGECYRIEAGAFASTYRLDGS